MADAVRDAKLKLTLDSAEAVRGMSALAAEGKKVEDQQGKITTAAEKAGKAIERYGATELSRPEMRRKRADERFAEKFANEQEVMEIAARREAAARYHKAQEETRRQQLRARMHNLGMIDARTDEQKIRDEEQRQSGLSGRIGGFMDRMGLGGQLGAMARTAAPAAAVATLARGTETMFSAAYNRDMTAAQGVESMPIFGTIKKSLREFAEALDGTAERTRRAGIRLAEDPQRLALEMAMSREEGAAGAAATGATNRATALGLVSLSPMQRFNRSTMAGEIGYQEEQQRIGPRDAAQIAAHEAIAARATAESADRQFRAADREWRDAQQARFGRGGRMNAAVGRESGYSRNQAGIAESGADRAQALKREAALLQRRNELLQQSQQAAVSASEAEARARQANIQLMQTELQITQQREQRLVGDATRLGGTNFIDRQLGLQAARMARDQGIGNVSPEVLSRARSFAPDWVQQQQMRFGENTPEMQAGRREGFLSPGTQTIDQLREQALQQQQQIREATLENQQRLATEVSDALEQTFERIMRSFAGRLSALESKMLVGRQLQNNQN